MGAKLTGTGAGVKENQFVDRTGVIDPAAPASPAGQILDA
jgi:hypothetical protein